ncbi:MAG: OmpA family protein [Bacteroidota bacterium]
MRSLLIILLFIVYLLGARWYFFCVLRGTCQDQTEQKDERLQTLNFTKGDTLILSGYDEFRFDSAQVDPVLNRNNEVFLDSVADYLNQKTAESITISAKYLPAESGISVGYYENFGLARAERIRRELMRRKVKKDRITLDYDIADTDVLLQPVLFGINLSTDTLQKLDFSFTNMTFSDANFEFGSDIFQPGDAFIDYADSVKTYLEVNPSKKLTIIGHTDNIDSEKFNYDLGLRRAQSAQEYFREMGVGVAIDTKSQGERQPVAKNTTPEGRQRNRRVNFVIQ